jgi:hypothetical protein
MRGCFGGCTFCSITEHEGRIIQSRSEASILQRDREIRDKTPGFTGVVSDLGGPTANMYRLRLQETRRSSRTAAALLRLSHHLPAHRHRPRAAGHQPVPQGARPARHQEDPDRLGPALRHRGALARIRQGTRVKHHVGGYLKIAPEHSQEGPLSKMMKPGMASYEQFQGDVRASYSKEAGKEQYLIPYFIAGHPGTTDEDMLNMALWLKRNGFKLDQVQTFLPTPLALATAMWHTEKNPLRKVAPQSEKVAVVRSGRQRKLQKAFLRYHDPENWPLLREALTSMGRADLIGPGKRHLVPARQPAGATAQGDGRPPLRGQKSAPATRRPAPSPAKPGRHGTLAGRHPGVPKHPLSRRKGG